MFFDFEEYNEKQNRIVMIPEIVAVHCADRVLTVEWGKILKVLKYIADNGRRVGISLILCTSYADALDKLLYELASCGITVINTRNCLDEIDNNKVFKRSSIMISNYKPS